jgi:hypothetical protein
VVVTQRNAALSTPESLSGIFRGASPHNLGGTTPASELASIAIGDRAAVVNMRFIVYYNFLTD